MCSCCSKTSLEPMKIEEFEDATKGTPSVIELMCFSSDLLPCFWSPLHHCTAFPKIHSDFVIKLCPDICIHDSARLVVKITKCMLYLFNFLLSNSYCISSNRHHPGTVATASKQRSTYSVSVQGLHHAHALKSSSLQP